MPRSSRSVALALLGSGAFLATLSCASPNGVSTPRGGPLAFGGYPGGVAGVGGGGGGFFGTRPVVHTNFARAVRGGFGSMVHAAST